MQKDETEIEDEEEASKTIPSKYQQISIIMNFSGFLIQ